MLDLHNYISGLNFTYFTLYTNLAGTVVRICVVFVWEETIIYYPEEKPSIRPGDHMTNYISDNLISFACISF